MKGRRQGESIILHAQMEPQQIIISAQYYNVLVFLYYKGMGGRGIND
jgi:hypothetical protein